MVGVNVDDDFVFFIVKEGVFFILIDVDILDFLLNVGSVFVFLWLLEIKLLLMLVFVIKGGVCVFFNIKGK